MFEYIIALLLFVLYLILIATIFILISKYRVNKTFNSAQKEYNNAFIINYIYLIYDKYVDMTRIKSDTQEAKYVENYFRDICELANDINVDNVETILENIEIIECDNKKNEKRKYNIGSVSRDVIDLMKMRNILIIMIAYHKLGIYNAYGIANNPEETFKDTIKILNKLSKNIKDFV